MKSMSHKGISILEITIFIMVLGLLGFFSVLGYKKFQQNSYQKQAMAHLAAYLKSSKLAIEEFGFNPGNFEALGFMPEGKLYYRIIAADNNSQKIPLSQRNNKFCFSTEECGNTCNSGNSVETLKAKTKGCCCSVLFTNGWEEVLPQYNEHKTSTVENHAFKVYAFSETVEDYLCVNQDDVYIQGCPEPELPTGPKRRY